MPHRAGTTAQRIRIGLTGLAFAFLLVLFASAITRSGRQNSPPTPAEQKAEATQPSEPLAELGVAPGADQSQTNTTNNSTK